MRVITACHGDLAQGLCAAAMLVLGRREGVLALGLQPGEAPANYAERMARYAEDAALERGVLVLTDLLGGTPHQAALGLGRSGRLGPSWAVVTGANLGMLLEAILQRGACTSPLELARAVASVGRAQITSSTEDMSPGG